MTPVPNFNKWCAVSNFLFKNIDFCIFTPKTPLVKENYFLTLWNFTYLKDTSFGKKLCNFELGLETKNEFEKWPLYNFVSVYTSNQLACCSIDIMKQILICASELNSVLFAFFHVQNFHFISFFFSSTCTFLRKTLSGAVKSQRKRNKRRDSASQTPRQRIANATGKR